MSSLLENINTFCLKKKNLKAWFRCLRCFGMKNFLWRPIMVRVPPSLKFAATALYQLFTFSFLWNNYNIFNTGLSSTPEEFILLKWESRVPGAADRRMTVVNFDVPTWTRRIKYFQLNFKRVCFIFVWNHDVINKNSTERRNIF